MATSTSNGIAAAIRYCKRWGVCVIRSSQAFHDTMGELTYESPLTANYLRLHPRGSENFAAESSVIDHTFGSIYWPEKGTDPYVLLHELSHLLCDEGEPHTVDEDREHTAFLCASVRWLVKNKAPGISILDYIEWERASYDRPLSDGETMLDHADRWFPTIVHAGLFFADGTPTFKPWERKPWAERLTKIADRLEPPTHRVVLP